MWQLQREMRRGMLIVLEGCDRCGKSTQCRRLVEHLQEHGHAAELMRFPERSTAIGSIIDRYLRKDIELEDHAAHLLFSANRWELASIMASKLASGTTLVVDRYAFSGVAFTSAKGLDLEWCKRPDAGLPMPDLLIHMELGAQEAEARGGFGDERYEVSEFQAIVKRKYQELYGAHSNLRPTLLDVSGRSIDAVAEQVTALVAPLLASEERRSATETLW